MEYCEVSRTVDNASAAQGALLSCKCVVISL